MVGIIREFALHYGFADSHIQVAESLVDDYIEMHRRVEELRERYPDNLALINKLTGMEFSKSDAEDFVVLTCPMWFEIYCSGFNAGRICERSNDPVIGFNYIGFATQSLDRTKPVNYLVVNNDYYYSDDPFYRTITVPHEREHVKNAILAPKLDRRSEVREDVREQLNRGVLGFLRHQIGERLLRFERNFEREIYKQYESAKDPDKKAFLLAEYMRLQRESALNMVKDELIAMKAEPGYRRHQYNIFLEKNGDAYDYLRELREYDQKKDDPLWQEIAQRVLVDEYRQIIDNAIKAFDQLTESGYLSKEVIAMLSGKRLAEWPKTARRILEQKENRQ